MKQGILFAVVLGILVPAIFMKTARNVKKTEQDNREETTLPEVTEQTQATQKPQVSFQLPVLMKDGSIVQMDLEAYITCVVLAEMPADFEKEALKAQGVVARTYALKGYFGKEKHSQKAICTDPSCCQAFCTYEDYMAKGGTQIAFDKVEDAVLQTQGMVLTYNGALIDATYFSCSGGKTEDAQAVWGSDVPYLQSVVSPGEEKAAHYMDTVFFTLQEFADCISIDKASLQGDWIGDISYTKGGGVASIRICGQDYTGTQMRQLLGLRSTAFVITAVGNTVTVTTKGFGHRVGMSQYGADAMAVSGSTYVEILTYYYQGTVLEQFEI